MTEQFLHLVKILFSRNFAYAKFHENKTLAKISGFTVVGHILLLSTVFSLLDKYFHFSDDVYFLSLL